MDTNKIIMPILGFVAVISLLDFQQKCTRDGNVLPKETEITCTCVGCQCCVGCTDTQKNDK